MAGGDLGSMAAAHVLVRCPVSGVAYTEVCWAAYVETSCLCHTSSWLETWNGEWNDRAERMRAGTVPDLHVQERIVPAPATFSHY